MGRFDGRATVPRRGPADMLKWKVVDAVAGKNRRDPGGFTVPVATPDRALVDGRAAQLTWLGHASFLGTLGGARFLVDPVLAPRVGHVPRRSPPGIPVDALPPVDLVLTSHNHHDHLDPWTIRRVPGAPLHVAPLGNADVLRRAGAREVVELDWWESTRHGDLEVTLVPARHWSMRGPFDRNEALWGGFVVRGPEGTAYHSGDTAHFDGFAEIGRRFGPIDWAMLPIGAYEPRWFMEPQHMCPEEAVEAAHALGARHFVAMHWGTFKLTDEPLAEPPERARAAWSARGGAEDRLWILGVGETRAL